MTTLYVDFHAVKIAAGKCRGRLKEREPREWQTTPWSVNPHSLQKPHSTLHAETFSIVSFLCSLLPHTTCNLLHMLCIHLCLVAIMLPETIINKNGMVAAHKHNGKSHSYSVTWLHSAQHSHHTLLHSTFNSQRFLPYITSCPVREHKASYIIIWICFWVNFLTAHHHNEHETLKGVRCRGLSYCCYSYCSCSKTRICWCGGGCLPLFCLCINSNTISIHF